MASENKILYIKGSRDVEVTKPDVTLGDLLSMESTDKLMLAKVRTLKITTHSSVAFRHTLHNSG